MAEVTLGKDELKKAINNTGLINLLSDEAIMPATTLTALLQSVVDREQKDKSTREELAKTLAKYEQPEEATLSVYQVREASNEFLSEAKDAYRRIGTTAASIANGEAKAIGSNMLGPLEFGKKGNKRFLAREVALRTGPKMKVRILTLKTHLEDFEEAVRFLKEQMVLVKKILSDAKEEFEKVVNKSPKGFGESSQAENYLQMVDAYLKVLMNEVPLETTLESIENSKSEFPSPTDVKEDRAWAHQLIKSLCDFGKFLTGFAAAESDLLKLEGVESLGQMQEAALMMLRNVIITDQRMYPSNNQIPVPPPPGLGRSLPDINGFFEAYEKRQEMLANAANADIVNRANAAFDRMVAFAMKQTLTLSAPKYAYVPRPSSEIYSEMVRKGKFSSTSKSKKAGEEFMAEARVLMPVASEPSVSTLEEVEDAYLDFDKSEPTEDDLAARASALSEVDFDDLD